MVHAVPVALAFETGFLESIAGFISARRGGSNQPCSNSGPSAEIPVYIVYLVSHMVSTCLFKFETRWKPEKVFKKLEATGILEQFLFCSATSMHKVTDDAMVEVFDNLLKCPVFVGKNFKNGTPCGETARAILRLSPGPIAYRFVACRYLQSLLALCWSVQSNKAIQACQCCKSSNPSKRFQSKLMQCSRCRLAYYCSKECQKADWKKHKKICKCLSKRLSESEQKNGDHDKSILNVFTQNNYVSIMKALVEECDKCAVKKKDMVLEVSFVPDSTGKIPALQDPPEFRIVPNHRYFDGSRLLESEKIVKGLDLGSQEEQAHNSILLCLKNNQLSPSPTSLLYICNFVNGCSVRSNEPQDQSQIYSQEAVDAFRLAMEDDNFGPIADICRGHESIMNMLRVQMGMPDDENTVVSCP